MVLKVEDPDDIKFTLTETMKLSDWKRLRDQLSESWPSSDLSNNISEMVTKAEKWFYPNV